MVLLATAFINLRFMMYSATLRLAFRPRPGRHDARHVRAAGVVPAPAPRGRDAGLLRRALRYVPPAVLTAIWAPELFFLHGGALELSWQNERLLAGAVAIAVAWRWRLTFATILSGLAALHLFAWLI